MYALYDNDSIELYDTSDSDSIVLYTTSDSIVLYNTSDSIVLYNTSESSDKDWIVKPDLPSWVSKTCNRMFP